MSSRTLTNSEIELLCKGPSFCPTPCRDDVGLQGDLRILAKNVKLMEFFDGNNTNSSSYINKLKNPSKFIVPNGRNSSVDKFCESVNDICNNLQSQPPISYKNNLNKDEINALKSLKTDPSITIKVSDKGGTFCIMDMQYYVNLIHKMLGIDSMYIFGSKRTYLKLRCNNDKNTFDNLTILLNKHKNCVTDNEFDYITKFQWRSAQFYGQPKCHKSPTIQNAIKVQNNRCINILCPEDLSLRPIVGGPRSPTSRLSEYLDHLFKPILKFINCDLKDELTMICDFPRNLCNNNNGYFVTFDIISMYTNIDLNLVLQATYYHFKKYNDTFSPNITWSFLRDSLIFLMNNNYFEFDNMFFKQLSGMAMGTHAAPTLGRISMGFLFETCLFPKLEKEISVEYADYFKEYFKIYIDDGFLYQILKYCHPSQILQFLNSLYPSIKFEMNFSKNNINFLSLHFKKIDNIFSMDIHYKPTDSHNYLLFNSNHPGYVKKSVPFNLARRLCTIVDNDMVLKNRLIELKSFLKLRGYPDNLINNCFSRAYAIPKSELRQVNNSKNITKSLNFITTFNNKNADIRSLVNSALTFLYLDPKMSKILKNIKIRWCYKQAKNLQRILCPSSLNFKIGHVSKCGGSRCQLCSMIITGHEIILKNNKFTFENQMNCNTTYCIYVLKCFCNKFYIGECEDLRARINLHTNQIKHLEYRKLYVSKHIFNCTKKFSFCPIYLMYNESLELRKNKENHFIKLLKPELNRDC